MNEQILEIIVRLVAVILIGYILPEVKRWLIEKIGEEKSHKLARLIYEFVRAAEQQFKEIDKTGEIRKNYVIAQLQELGYKITDEINARIEAEVFGINLFNEPKTEQTTNE